MFEVVVAAFGGWLARRVVCKVTQAWAAVARGGIQFELAPGNIPVPIVPAPLPVAYVVTWPTRSPAWPLPFYPVRAREIRPVLLECASCGLVTPEPEVEGLQLSDVDALMQQTKRQNEVLCHLTHRLEEAKHDLSPAEFRTYHE